MTDDILKQQLSYYRARAQEYDESIQQTGLFASEEPGIPDADREWAQIVAALHTLAPVERVLELACGTGLWTKELVQIGTSITALDGAPEMLDANRAKLPDAAIEYTCADLFEWEPEEQYDLVFFAFWLSHVPPELLANFLYSAAAAVRVGGRIFIVDEPERGLHLSGASKAGMYQHRTLYDGRTFQIVKVYYDPGAIRVVLRQHGFENFTSVVGNYFFSLSGVRVR
jgi:demethylmenaquinone methyltransferase/2-methoxy-6-polyprenyl-1,4-benzoquinol methylase